MAKNTEGTRDTCATQGSISHYTNRDPRASMCSKCLLTPGYSGAHWQLREAQAHPLSATPTHVRPHFRRAESYSQSGHLPRPHHPPPGPSCTDCDALSPCWAPGSVVRILHRLSHVIPHGPPCSGTGILIATSQRKKLGAEACYCLPFQEQEEDTQSFL